MSRLNVRVVEFWASVMWVIMVAFDMVYVPCVTVVPRSVNCSSFKIPSALKVYLLQAEFSQA